MSVFVSYDRNDVVTGIFARPKAGRVKRDETHPDVIAWREASRSRREAADQAAASRRAAAEADQEDRQALAGSPYDLIGVLARQLEAEIPVARRTAEFVALLARLDA